jgi:hypothetical protein
MSKEAAKEKRREEKFRRNLRTKYLELITDTNSSKALLCQPGTNDLLDRIEEGNRLFSDVVHAREGALDAQWFTQTSKYGLEQVNRIHVGQEFSAKAFLKNIVTKYKVENRQEDEANEDDDGVDINWTALGRDVFQYFNRTPTVTFMNGPLQKLEVKKIERKPRAKEDNDQEATVTEPDKIVKQDNKRDYTSTEVAEIHKHLRKKQDQSQNKPVQLLDVVVDPNSFTHTIENMFHYAFLIKEGRAGISVDSDPSNLQASIKEPPQSSSSEQKKKQAVLKLNLNMWKQLRERVNPDATLSRKRPAPEDSTNSQAKRRKL